MFLYKSFVGVSSNSFVMCVHVGEFTGGIFTVFWILFGICWVFVASEKSWAWWPAFAPVAVIVSMIS